ncbi:helix-turn-helix domain-containing protein [Isoptericola halotolerans]|uniref:helix-turn-helix domain-containing protein n=1 Tax=Isoptericola halotolerans TaxID=300560 RepID=UPI00388E6C5E
MGCLTSSTWRVSGHRHDPTGRCSIVSKRRLVITAVLAGASQSEVARRYDVSQGWVSRLMARYRTEGQAAFEPRSRRPHTYPAAIPEPVVQQILACAGTSTNKATTAAPTPSPGT